MGFKKFCYICNMKKQYMKPALKVVTLDATISLCMNSVHGHGGGGHGHGHTSSQYENAFGGSSPRNVSGFGDTKVPF